MAKQFTLGKDQRLKSRKLIEQLFADGKKFSLGSLRVHFLVADRVIVKDRSLQVGVGVGTRHFKKAVDRNRVRRMIKEAWRLQKNSLEEKIPAEKKMPVFLVYTGREILPYQDLSEQVKKIIQKLSLAVAKPS